MTKLSMFRCLSVLFSTAMFTNHATANSMQPISSHFSSPVENLFNIPSFSETDLLSSQKQSFTLRLEAVSNAVAMDNASEAVRFDGETWRLTPNWEMSLAENWQLSVELPLIRHTGGFLDNAIDQWHDVFNFREGSRGNFDRNELVYGYSQSNTTDFLLTNSENGLGDLKIKLSHRLPIELPLTLHMHLKAPTGDEDDLMGSGAWDAGLSISYLKKELFNIETLSASIEAGQHYLGDSDQIRNQKHHLSTLYGALFWNFYQGFTAKAQLEGRSQLSDSDLEPIGSEGLQTTLGLTWNSSDNSYWDFAFVEDIKTDSTADVTFLTSWTTEF